MLCLRLSLMFSVLGFLFLKKYQRFTLYLTGPECGAGTVNHFKAHTFVLVWFYNYFDLSVTDESYVDETRVWHIKL